MSQKKVSISAIHPYSIKYTSGIFKKCYIGVSMNNPFFWGKYTFKLFEWVSQDFESCVIIIGDYLHRHNIEIFGNIHTYSDKKCVKDMGDEMIERIKKLNLSDKFSILRWEDYLHRTDVQIELSKMKSYYEHNSLFKQSILTSCTQFLTKKANKNIDIITSMEVAQQKSKEYILEELAVFSILIEEGFPVQVYPGTQVDILKKLADKKINNIDSSLCNGIFIDLKIQ